MKIWIVIKKAGSFGLSLLSIILVIVLTRAYWGPNQPKEKPVDNTPLLFNLAESGFTGSIKSVYKSEDKQPCFTDLKGYNHYKYNHILCAGDGKDVESENRYYVTVQLDGNYSKIVGNLYAQDTNNYCWLEFYDDETCIYSTGIVSGDTPVVEVELDITGMDALTVYLCRDNEGTQPNGWIYSDLLVLTASEQRSDYIDDEGPSYELPDQALLFDLPLYSGSEVDSSEETVDIEDYEGNVHNQGTFNHILCKGSGQNLNSYQEFVRYKIDGKYSKISGKLFCRSNNTDNTWLEFYDGETLIGATEMLNSDNPSIQVDIDIIGVKCLTVYLCADRGYSGNWIISELIIQ